MDDDDLLFGSRWLRVRWNDIIAFGVGFDPNSLVFGLYLGPIGIYLGDTQGDSNE